jgi:hypothetical protein
MLGSNDQQFVSFCLLKLPNQEQSVDKKGEQERQADAAVEEVWQGQESEAGSHRPNHAPLKLVRIPHIQAQLFVDVII